MQVQDKEEDEEQERPLFLLKQAIFPTYPLHRIANRIMLAETF